MNKKGFTLVEVLAVISILALIMIVVGTNGFGAFNNTKQKIFEEAKKEVDEAAKVVMTEIEHCDDNLDSDALSSEKNGSLANLAVLNGIDGTVTCYELKNKAKEEGIKINIDYLIDNSYVTGSNALKLKETNSLMEYFGTLEFDDNDSSNIVNNEVKCKLDCTFDTRPKVYMVLDETKNEIVLPSSAETFHFICPDKFSCNFDSANNILSSFKDGNIDFLKIETFFKKGSFYEQTNNVELKYAHSDEVISAYDFSHLLEEDNDLDWNTSYYYVGDNVWKVTYEYKNANEYNFIDGYNSKSIEVKLVDNSAPIFVYTSKESYIPILVEDNKVNIYNDFDIYDMDGSFMLEWKNWNNLDYNYYTFDNYDGVQERNNDIHYSWYYEYESHRFPKIITDSNGNFSEFTYILSSS